MLRICVEKKEKEFLEGKRLAVKSRGMKETRKDLQWSRGTARGLSLLSRLQYNICEQFLYSYQALSTSVILFAWHNNQ